ncbi:hypothetical protein CAPTEDRAFT_218193 [Capitella teleta]|uniref:Hexosyltransferase n=1 Tax=Capitella teleta TaxID=283909 RepID=R7TL82_CAPTE|nr:hypothetical protein CAPTEDRAFT_218193 [Capitella teleta]|eukprot:ELT94429.1 hypothetical protein CAPTEDRAFT_218193 [Capitella teleta]
MRISLRGVNVSIVAPLSINFSDHLRKQAHTKPPLGEDSASFHLSSLVSLASPSIALWSADQWLRIEFVWSLRVLPQVKGQTADRTGVSQPGSEFQFEERNSAPTHIRGPDPWHIQKTFGVLQQMCSSHIDQFDWFVRAVDDAYIKVDQLLQFLSTLDKKQKVYTGFLTIPFYEVERKALSGAKYCHGGLCPHLSTCRSEYTAMPGDVALAKCIAEKLGIHCQRAQREHELFYHSYEDKSFHLLEDLMEQHASLTLHPVKQPWLMNALHHRYTNGVITHLTAKLRDLIAAKYGITESMRQDSNVTDFTTDDFGFQGDDLALNEHPVTMFTSKNHVMRSDACTPVSPTDPHTRREIDEVIRMANTSSLMGDFLTCPHLVSGYSQPSARGTSYEIQLLCSPLGKPFHKIATSVTLHRKLNEPRLMKVRKVSTPARMVFVVSAKLDDEDLMSFMLLLRDLIGDDPDLYAVYVVLEHAKKFSKYKQKHPQNINDYSSVDLEAWYRSKNINLQTYNLFNFVNRTMTYHTVFMDIQKRYDKSVVLLTTVNVHFDKEFLARCRALVRPHRRAYRPYPGRNIFPRYTSGLYPTQEAFNVMWRDAERPMCVHSDDVYLLLDDPMLALRYKSAKIPGPFSRTDPKKFRRKAIRVISAYDPGVQMD